MEIVEVYHAGTQRIEVPDCRFGRKNLDFGHGFYVTDIYDQALNLARVRGSNRKQPPVINIYDLNRGDLLRKGKSLVFEAYDEEWLEFIVACRSGGNLWRPYDYIEGGVADDRVIDTVNLFTQGFISKERALENLRYLKPNNQICLLNQELTNECLNFKDCLVLDSNEIL